MPVKTRPKPNLTDLTRPIQKQDFKGFLYLFRGRYTELPTTIFTRLWTGYVYPQTFKDIKTGKLKPTAARELALVSSKNTPAGLLTLKKESDGFLARVPILLLRADSSGATPQAIVHFLGVAFGTRGDHAAVEEAIKIENMSEKAREFLQTDGLDFTINITSGYIDFLGLSADVTNALKESLRKVLFTRKGLATVISAEFFIPKHTAELMTSTDWVELRNIDLYPLLLDWVASGKGQLKAPALQSLPISKIAKSLPSGGLVRVNEHNLSTGPDGHPYYIPKELDNTGKYERLYDQKGSKEDGTFNLVTTEDVEFKKELPPRLPANVPVLVDWINSKFSYTLTTGELRVMDLTRFRPANATHIVGWLNRQVGVEFFTRCNAISESVGVKLSSIPTNTAEISSYYNKLAQDYPEAPARLDRLVRAANFVEYCMMVAEDHHYFEEIPLPDDKLVNATLPNYLLAQNSTFVPAQHIGKSLSELFAVVLQRLENLYSVYSVSGALENLAQLSLIANYADRYGELHAEDVTLRTAAITQGYNPNQPLESIPLISSKVGRMPHQIKISNILRDDPDFAILPVQAGGGKTWLGVEDILKQIKKNQNFPYLVLCPDHLVPQYVSELNFFTEGRLNPLGITSRVVKYDGFERIGKLIHAMPRNSVVIASYDVCKLAGRMVCYGTARVLTYPIAEFLSQFEFGYVFCDESHYLKNDSKRSAATLSLVANIPKRRIASGTLLVDTPVDLALQVAILDPTIFGTQENFKATYGEEFRGERVVKWKENANREIMKKLKQHVVWAPARRREWAAWLPKPKFAIHRVQLTAKQYEAYNLIFRDMMVDLESAKTAAAKKLKKLLEKGKDESELTEEDSDAIEKLIGPYLQRLEQYCVAPSRDAGGAGSNLPENEKVSPVPAKVAEIIEDHISSGASGKVLIFTSYESSALEIYENMPPALKSKVLLYRASTKIENKSQFENDPNIVAMVGIELSMNTGLNLQMASRLIRVESVFNPGTLEQGQSRILRPELKKKDTREFVYFDWIVVDKTVSTTKMCRLISKLITVTKFEEHDNPIYADIPEVDVVPLDLNTIENVNDFGSDLLPYLQVYQQLEQATYRDYEEYKEAHPDQQALTPVEKAPDPEGVVLMDQVPYVPGMSLPFQEQFGLIRLDEYMRGLGANISVDTSDDADDASDEDEEEESTDTVDFSYYANQVIGKRCNTEWGDGEIIKMHPRSARIRLDSGAVVSLRTFVVFMMEKPTPLGVSIRKQILEQVGLPIVETNAGYGVRVKVTKSAQKRVKEIQEEIAIKEEPISVELQFSISNGFLGLHYVGDEENERAVHALQAAGFKRAPPMFFAHMPTHRHLWKTFEAWTDAGFKFSQVVDTADDHFAHLYAWMKSGKHLKRNAPFNFARKMDLIDFYKKELKPNPNGKLIKPYPIIEDGQIYIALPANGQVGSLNAIRVKVPGVRWKKQEGAFIYHALNLSSAGSKIKELLGLGIEITNINELKKDFKRLIRTPLREVEVNPLSISVAKVVTYK